MKLTILILFFLSSSIIYSQTGTVIGCTSSTFNDVTELLPFTCIAIDGKARTSSNLDAYYTIDSIPVGIHTISAGYVTYRLITKKIEITNNETLVVYFDFRTRPVKSDNDKTCPICGKTDLVTPVVKATETLPVNPFQIDSSYYQNCEHLSPCYLIWYCKRDHIKF